MWTPGGFHRPLPARERVWHTATGKANFVVPSGLDENPDMPAVGDDILRLITLRSDDQFTSSIYSYNDSYRGIHGSRSVLLMNRDDMRRLGIDEGERLEVATVASDGPMRGITLRATGYDISLGCAAGYYPECNLLIPLWHHAEHSKVPAAKFIPVRVRRIA